MCYRLFTLVNLIAHGVRVSKWCYKVKHGYVYEDICDIQACGNDMYYVCIKPEYRVYYDIARRIADKEDFVAFTKLPFSTVVYTKNTMECTIKLESLEGVFCAHQEYREPEDVLAEYLLRYVNYEFLSEHMEFVPTLAGWTSRHRGDGILVDAPVYVCALLNSAAGTTFVPGKGISVRSAFDMVREKLGKPEINYVLFVDTVRIAPEVYDTLPYDVLVVPIGGYYAAFHSWHVDALEYLGRYNVLTRTVDVLGHITGELRKIACFAQPDQKQSILIDS